LIWVSGEAEIFLQIGLDSQIIKQPVGQITSTVAWMERSAIRESLVAAPDFALLHPGYALPVIARSEATKQSSFDCAEPRDGLLRRACHRAGASRRPVGSQ
jgi:hypothetical protein